jgi:molecular chaperone Hsp33
MIQNSDSYKIGIWEEYNFRFLIADCTNSVAEVVRRHKYIHSSSQLVAKTMMGAFFLAGMVKEETMVSIQMEGDGEVERVMGYSDRIGRMRGLVKIPNHQPQNDPSLGVGKGIFRVTRWGGVRKLHQSITKLEKAPFESNLLHHISESDQLISFVSIYLSEDKSCKGMILQALPFTEQSKIDELMDRLGEMHYTTEQLFEGSLDVVLGRLEKSLNTNALTLDTGIPEFYCGCTMDKIKNVIRSMGKEEAYSILEEQGRIEIICEFCNEVYELDSEEVHLLFI